MPNIKAELIGARGQNSSSVLIFAAAIGKITLQEDSQHLFYSMTPNGVVMKTRTTEVGCHSANNFQ